MVPKGKLIAVGGAETRNVETPEKLGVLRQIITEMRSRPVIEIIPTASQIPEKIGKEYVDAFHHLGCSRAQMMMIREHEETYKPEFIERIKNADGVMFSGGDQNLLAAVFLGSPLLAILKDKYNNDPNFVIAGTSAGAMAQSEKMINGGTPVEALMKGKASMIEGLGFINTAIIDSHFVNRGRFGRLMVAVAEHPTLTGIGVSEDTAVVIREARYLECIGSELVVIMDGSELRNPFAEDDERPPNLNIERMIFHILSSGMIYDMVEKKMRVKEFAV